MIIIARHPGRVDRRRVPGEGRYARVEREQRWALRRRPDGLIEPTDIVDRYVGATLRLRCMSSGSGVVYKFGQKVRPDERSPAVVKMTNLYVSEPEYALLRSLPGHELRKTRWRWPAAPRVVVDEFGGHLSGLVLAETELGPADERRPGLAGVDAVDVTDDDRFSGGALARLPAGEVAGLVAAVFGP